MNIREDIQQLKTGKRDLRKFGFLVGGAFATFALLLWLRHKAAYPYFLWASVTLIALGAVLPRALKYVYILWMTLAFALGFIMTRVILTLFFFLVVTPIGLVARLFGKDFLRLKLDKSALSYWIHHEPKAKTPRDYERQF
jgi:hypothetical protein